MKTWHKEHLILETLILQPKYLLLDFLESGKSSKNIVWFKWCSWMFEYLCQPPLYMNYYSIELLLILGCYLDLANNLWLQDSGFSIQHVIMNVIMGWTVMREGRRVKTLVRKTWVYSCKFSVLVNKMVTILTVIVCIKYGSRFEMGWKELTQKRNSGKCFIINYLKDHAIWHLVTRG